jgi:SAM-dependent methyltransferase
MDQPWEHPDWYDLHDTTWTAGSEREPEHYRESMLALPPLDRDDYLIDAGAGTGKLAAVVAAAYPRLGRVTLVEPSEVKLERAKARLAKALPQSRVDGMALGIGRGDELPKGEATVVTVGSVLLVTMELGGGTLGEGLVWMRSALADVFAMLRPGGLVYDLETLAAPWSQGSIDDPVRRLNCREFLEEFARAGFVDVECVYRFRDRVTVRGRRP